MDQAFPTASPPESSPRGLRLRLAFGAIVWRLTFVLLILAELGLWHRLRVALPWARPGRRFRILLFFTPRTFVAALFVAGAATVVMDLILRFVVQPMVRLWHNPPAGGEAGSFHLDPHERVEARTRARRKIGRRWQPGCLLRTNTRLAFFPMAWDAEPWLVRLFDVDDAWTEATRPWAWGFVGGLPDHLLVRERTGRTETFAVADPEGVMAWLAPAHSVPARRLA